MATTSEAYTDFLLRKSLYATNRSRFPVHIPCLSTTHRVRPRSPKARLILGLNPFLFLTPLGSTPLAFRHLNIPILVVLDSAGSFQLLELLLQEAGRVFVGRALGFHRLLHLGPFLGGEFGDVLGVFGVD